MSTPDARSPDLPSPDDADSALVALMVDYQAGHLAAFERLYATLAAELEAFLASQLRDRQPVRDLLQETFLELHRSRRTYRPPLPVRPWVFGVARNVVRRHYRQAARRARYETPLAGPEVPAADAATSAQSPSPAGALDLERALAQLPEAKRHAWLLHHSQGLSFKEIARRLGIAEDNARLRSSRAMSALRALLGVRHGGEDE